MSAFSEEVVTALTKPFWDAAADGRLALQRCEACGERIFPPRNACPGCWATSLAWVDASGAATLESFSVVHRAPNAEFAAKVPYVVALVLLDEGPRMMTNIVGRELGELTVGMRLRVAFPGEGHPTPVFTIEGLS